MGVKVLVGVIILLNCYFLFYLIKDLKNHVHEMKEEKGSIGFYAILGFISEFLSTMGISDFAINTVVYRTTKKVDDRLIPPTLNTEATIPCMFMALAYITTIDCDFTTLIVLIVAQTLGAFFSPKIVTNLPADAIRWFMGIGLGVAAVMIFGNQFSLFGGSGEAVGLTGGKLVFAAVAMFFLGAFNNIGIGAFAPTTALIYALGVSPLVAFPIMMGACACSMAIGSTEYVKLENYARKPTAVFLIPASLGVICAAYFVVNIDLYYLKWIVFVVVCYASFDLIKNQIRQMRA